MPTPLPKPTDGELEILRVLWDRCGVNQYLAAVGTIKCPRVPRTRCSSAKNPGDVTPSRTH